MQEKMNHIKDSGVPSLPPPEESPKTWHGYLFRVYERGGIKSLAGVVALGIAALFLYQYSSISKDMATAQIEMARHVKDDMKGIAADIRKTHVFQEEVKVSHTDQLKGDIKRAEGDERREQKLQEIQTELQVLNAQMKVIAESMADASGQREEKIKLLTEMVETLKDQHPESAKNTPAKTTPDGT